MSLTESALQKVFFLLSNESLSCSEHEKGNVCKDTDRDWKRGGDWATTCKDKKISLATMGLSGWRWWPQTRDIKACKDNRRSTDKDR